MLRKLLLGCVIAIFPCTAMGDPPTIHVDWDEVGEPSSPDDYGISTTDPDFPNVELKAGSLTWRVWSTDPDNPNGICDIGTISSPHPQNFGVKLQGDSSTPGARECKGINLDPQGAGSDANYGRLTGGSITGNLGLTNLQRSSGGTGGDSTGDFTVAGNVTRDVSIAVLGPFATLEIHGTLSADLEITVRMEAANLVVSGPVTASAQIVVADMVTSDGEWCTIDLGGSTASVSGDLTLSNGIPLGQLVSLGGVMQSTTSIDLNNEEVTGTMVLARGGSGTIVQGGTVNTTGIVRLTTDASGAGDFSGSASFARLAWNSSYWTKALIEVAGGHDLAGTIRVTGDAYGYIHVTGDVTSSGTV